MFLNSLIKLRVVPLADTHEALAPICFHVPAVQPQKAAVHFVRPELRPAAGNYVEAVAVMVEMAVPRKTFVHVRGNFKNRGEQVSPGVPRFLGRLPAGEKADRLSFAKWLVDGNNPLVARVIVNRYPDIATIARSVKNREGKVYVDYLQNGHGRLLVAPFSVRAEPAASVSMPLRWSELNGRLSNPRFHIKNAQRRMQRLGNDPLAEVLTAEADLVGALEALGQLG